MELEELRALLGEFVAQGEDPADVAQRNQEARANRPRDLLTPQASVEDMLRARRSAGLNASTDVVLSLLGNPTLRAPGDVQAYGLVLTPQELAELDERLAVQDEMYRIYQWILSNIPPDDFGGVWVSEGLTYIGVTSDRDAYQAALQAIFPLPRRLRVVDQEHSGIALQRMRLETREHLLDGSPSQAFTIVSTTVDRPANIVKVGASEGAADAQAFYDEQFGPGWVRVVSEQPEQAARNTFRQPTRGGLLIGRTAANDETCTSSFVSRSFERRWLLTAGHCAGNINLPMIFQGQRQINPLERVNVGSLDANDRADVGAVALVPELWSPWLFVEPADFAHVIRRSHARNSVQGGLVQMALGRSNISTVATVINADRDITVTSGAYGNYRLLETKQLDRGAVGGDSGSPVFQSDIAEGVIVTDGASYVQIQNQLTAAGMTSLQFP